MKHLHRRHSESSFASRHGISLFEVVLAFAILLGALAAWSQLISTGSRAQIISGLQTEAVLRCESKVAEVIAGVEPLQASGPNQFIDDPDGDWNWTAEVGEGPWTDLLAVTVMVNHTTSNENISYTLTRYVRDPLIFEEAALDAEISGDLE